MKMHVLTGNSLWSLSSRAGICLLLLLLPLLSFNQSTDRSTSGAPADNPSGNLPKNTGVKEDVNEFLGYEDLLLVRYLSMPYDAVMNTNMVSYFVDIGFIFLALLPLIYFWSSSGIWWHRLGAIGLLFIFLILAVPSAFMNRNKVGLENVSAEINSQLSSHSFSQDPLIYLSYQGKRLFSNIYEMVYPILENISGPQDRITYPLLFALLVIFVLLLERRVSSQTTETKTILHFLLIYGFLWVLLSSGIPWYGLLLFPVLIMLSVRGLIGSNDGATERKKYNSRNLIMAALAVIWLMVAIPYRFANYEPIDEVKAKLPFMASVAQYQAGQIERDQVFDRIFPKYRMALEFINQEKDSYVYRVGTLMPFFIKKNDRRVFSDNFLDFFQNLQQEFTNPQELALALRAYGFRYIVIDLNLPVNDNTPEGSLKTKFQNFMNFIYHNPQLILVATDRVVRNAEGTAELRVFPDGDQVENLGWFAVYQII